MADGKVAATLAEIRELVAERDRLAVRMRTAPGGWHVFNAAQNRLAKCVPRLLDAVEAALKRHAPVSGVRLVPCPQHKHWSGPLDGEKLTVHRACLQCQAFEELHCRGCVSDDGRFEGSPCGEYQDIARALAAGSWR